MIDERGVIKKANESALQMLNVEKLEGRKWFEVINEVFRPQKTPQDSTSSEDTSEAVSASEAGR